MLCLLFWACEGESPLTEFEGDVTSQFNEAIYIKDNLDAELESSSSEMVSSSSSSIAFPFSSSMVSSSSAKSSSSAIESSSSSLKVSSSSYLSDYEKCVKNYYDGYRCCDVYGNYTCKSSSSQSSSSMSALETCENKYNSTCCNNCYNDYFSYECKYCTDKCYNAYGDYLCNATATQKSMKFIFTYFNQLSGWDGLGTSTNDGDPRISFMVYYIKTNGAKTSEGTGTLLSLTDTGYWTGEKSVTLTVPAATDTIKICPTVIDKDISFNDDMSSGYCYKKAKVGTLKDYEYVEQEDYCSDYRIKWEWYLF